MRVPKLTRCNVIWICSAIEEVGRRQVVRRVNVVTDNEVGPDMLDAERPDNRAFGEVVTPSTGVERPSDWGAALDNPAPVVSDAQGYEGRRSGDVTVGCFVTSARGNGTRTRRRRPGAGGPFSGQITPKFRRRRRQPPG